ncbi:hypothetical protein F5884DRAFT_742980 [Xylogone sp. PMI_703]|nr:hypothetical protein F5884DRAFT_742980 [Xylogone sp. PMI_703]
MPDERSDIQPLWGVSIPKPQSVQTTVDSLYNDFAYSGPLSVPSATPSSPETWHHLIPRSTIQPLSEGQFITAAADITQAGDIPRVMNICRELVKAEADCLHILVLLDQRSQSGFDHQQWRDFVNLHQTLIHYHYDFLLAAQGLSELREIASDAMPTRMWVYGIHNFLEHLRLKLPKSLEYTLCFIYHAYSMMTLFYETVPIFENTWLECLGDLGRYRYAVRGNDIQDQEIWATVAQDWYLTASDRKPATGRLYHHAAILSTTDSLCVREPFAPARASIMSPLKSFLRAKSIQIHYEKSFENTFITVHGILFTRTKTNQLETVARKFPDLLNDRIEQMRQGFVKQGPKIALLNCIQLLDFANHKNKLMQAAFAPSGKGEDVGASEADMDDHFDRAALFFNETFSVVLRKIVDPSVLPFVHVTLVFVLHIAKFPDAMSAVGPRLPWDSLATALDTLLATHRNLVEPDSKIFPGLEMETPKPFRNDYVLRGLLFSEDYFPPGWFPAEMIDEDDETDRPKSVNNQHRERILWIAIRIAGLGKWLNYERENMEFTAS